MLKLFTQNLILCKQRKKTEKAQDCEVNFQCWTGFDPDPEVQYICGPAKQQFNLHNNFLLTAYVKLMLKIFDIIDSC